VSVQRIFFVSLVLGIASVATGLTVVQAQTSPAPVVPYSVVGDAIPMPLTEIPGDPKRGAAIVVDRKLGNCLACHTLPIANEADPGDVGPPLAGVGKALTAGRLRLRIVDMKKVDPNTIMPAFYRMSGLHDVDPKFSGKPILEAQQIEDVVAYLQSLK
jgi:sulfur-oxidizing protein SoxX